MKNSFKTRLGSLILLIACMVVVTANGQVASQDKVTRIHEKAFTVDSHTDSPMDIYSSGFNMGERHDAHKDGSKLDFIRMKEGGLDAVFFAVFLGQEARNAEANLKAKMEAMGILDSIYSEVGRHPDIAGLAFTPKDAYKLEKQHKRAIFIGMENGYPLGNDLSLVDTFFRRGVRYITLCHTRNNDICDSSTDSTEHHGLTPFGKQVLQRMNKLGIMVDVSHISDTSFYQVIALSKTPVIASHSDTKALCNNPRNLSDDMIKKLASNGGVLQLCLLSDYVKTMPPNPARDSARKEILKKFGPYDKLDETAKTAFRKEYYGLNEIFPPNLASVSDLVDHLDHIVALAGIDHVGIGSDFDGGGGLKDCYDVSEMKNITAELVRRGYSEKDIRKIWGGNLMRVMKAVQKAAVN